MENEIIDFRFLTILDNYDITYDAWSRIYEYPYVLNMLINLGANENSKIHNSSFGFEGCHILFKNELDRLFPQALHSDIKQSNLSKTFVYDIRMPIQEEYSEFFDFVLNISTIEEVHFDNIQIISNLLRQVKINGYLIITFDYSSEANDTIDLKEVENYVGCYIENKNPFANISPLKCVSPTHALPNNLNCGVLVLKKLQ